MEQLLLTLLSVSLLVGLFDGVNREFTRREKSSRREELIRRGYII